MKYEAVLVDFSQISFVCLIAWFAWAGLIRLGGLPDLPEHEWSDWNGLPDLPEQEWSGWEGAYLRKAANILLVSTVGKKWPLARVILKTQIFKKKH